MDSFNRVNAPYKSEVTLILLANAWELSARKALSGSRAKLH